jgi:hypothetical protein
MATVIRRRATTRPVDPRSGIPTDLLALAMLNTPYGRAIVVLGVAAGIVDVAAAYPWLIGPGLTSASEVLFAGWFVAVGVKLASSDFRVRSYASRDPCAGRPAAAWMEYR